MLMKLSDCAHAQIDLSLRWVNIHSKEKLCTGSTLVTFKGNRFNFFFLSGEALFQNFYKLFYSLRKIFTPSVLALSSLIE